MDLGFDRRVALAYIRRTKGENNRERLGSYAYCRCTSFGDRARTGTQVSSSADACAATIREVAATGIAAVDELLHGGLPVGAISELTGAASSGRTSLALRFVAQRTAEARACAWVDVNDAFDPESAAANGVQLRRLLWMRCRDEAGVARRRMQRVQTEGQGAARGPRGRGSTRGCGRRICCCRRVDLRALCWTWAIRRRSKRAVFRWPHGSATGRRRSERSAAWWCWAGGPMRSRLRRWCWSARQLHAEQAGGTVLRGFEFTVRRGRERLAPMEITTRKPPAATWQANAAWDHGERAHEPNCMHVHGPRSFPRRRCCVCGRIGRRKRWWCWMAARRRSGCAH